MTVTDGGEARCPRCGSRFVHVPAADGGANRKSWLAIVGDEITVAVTLEGPPVGGKPVANLQVVQRGPCKYAVSVLVLAAVRACKQDGFLKLVVEDECTWGILCELLPRCGLHAPQVRLRQGRQIHEVYFDLYSRAHSTSTIAGIADFIELFDHENSSESMTRQMAGAVDATAGLLNGGEL